MTTAEAIPKAQRAGARGPSRPCEQVKSPTTELRDEKNTEISGLQIETAG